MASSGEKYDACPTANALSNEANISAFHIRKDVACAKAHTFVFSPEHVRHNNHQGGASMVECDGSSNQKAHRIRGSFYFRRKQAICD
jgi:hypothetical protein